MTKPIDICLCTYRRNSVSATLQSLARIKKEKDWDVHIIVADNDDTPSAKELVKKVAEDFDLSLTYMHAPKGNISLARNACIEASTAPYIAFINDDECATPLWLVSLVEKLEAENADVVLGPVQALYNSTCAAWIPSCDFHATLPVWVKGEIRTGYACNVLFKRTASSVRDVRFRVDLAKAKSADAVFFDAIYRAGGKIVYAPKAIVTEKIVPEKASFKWLLLRRFRSGQTHGLLLAEKTTKQTAKRLQFLFVELAKTIACFFIGLLSFWRMERLRGWVLRGMVHAGVASRLFHKTSSNN